MLYHFIILLYAANISILEFMYHFKSFRLTLKLPGPNAGMGGSLTVTVA